MFQFADTGSYLNKDFSDTILVHGFGSGVCTKREVEGSSTTNRVNIGIGRLLRRSEEALQHDDVSISFVRYDDCRSTYEERWLLRSIFVSVMTVPGSQTRWHVLSEFMLLKRVIAFITKGSGLMLPFPGPPESRMQCVQY